MTPNRQRAARSPSELAKRPLDEQQFVEVLVRVAKHLCRRQRLEKLPTMFVGFGIAACRWTRRSGYCSRSMFLPLSVAVTSVSLLTFLITKHSDRCKFAAFSDELRDKIEGPRVQRVFLVCSKPLAILNV